MGVVVPHLDLLVHVLLSVNDLHLNRLCVKCHVRHVANVHVLVLVLDLANIVVFVVHGLQMNADAIDLDLIVRDIGVGAGIFMIFYYNFFYYFFSRCRLIADFLALNIGI